MKDNSEKISDFLDQFGLTTLIADGFDEAILGVYVHDDNPKVIYDSHKCVDMLMEQGMTNDDAQEYFDYNISGAYMGEKTPLFIHPISGI